MVRPAEVVSIVTMIVVEATVEVVVSRTATADLHVTMIVSVALMGVVTTMALVALIAMHLLAVMIATAAVETIVVAVTNLTVETVGEMAADPVIMRLTESRRLPGTLEILTVEVEPKTTILTIGTLVDKLRSANLLRCGALCEIMRPNLSPSTKLSVSISIAVALVAADQLSSGEFSTQIKSVSFVYFLRLSEARMDHTVNFQLGRTICASF